MAGIVLNRTVATPNDASLTTNRQELAARCVATIPAEVTYQGGFDTAVD